MTRQPRTSLEVGFPNGMLPPRFVSLRGAVTRTLGAVSEFPYEDAQFEVVLMDASIVSRATIKEANRVLKPEGRLVFAVPEKNRAQPDGYTQPALYALLRDGFNISSVDCPPWWRFRPLGRQLTVTACKKAWKSYRGLTGGRTAFPLSPLKGG